MDTILNRAAGRLARTLDVMPGYDSSQTNPEEAHQAFVDYDLENAPFRDDPDFTNAYWHFVAMGPRAFSICLPRSGCSATASRHELRRTSPSSRISSRLHAVA